MIFENLIENKTVVLLECISGSRAYGLALPHSDMDIKGVFLLPKDAFFSLEYTEQLSNASNDIVYYELKRFIDLLSKNNPNILELLATPDDCILVKHALMKDVQTELFLSRQCKQTFAGYAQAQIKKARGLNKRISKPMCKERKSILNFCYVIQGQGAVSLNQWLQINAFHQEDCGLTNIPHIKDVYSIFHNSQNKDGKFKGIFSGNVRAVFSDRKLSDLTSGLPTNFRPDLLSTNNYYLFGMLMPGRNSNAPNYRCGFNGKEKDDEVTCSAGVTYDYPAGADVR